MWIYSRDHLYLRFVSDATPGTGCEDSPLCRTDPLALDHAEPAVRGTSINTITQNSTTTGILSRSSINGNVTTESVTTTLSHSSFINGNVTTESVATTLSHSSSINENVSIKSVADLYAHLVIATAFSSNHFEEGKGMIGSVQRCLPDKKIIVYDLGLNWSQRRELNSYCNVELRHFPFDNYEPFIKDLGYFSWKVVIAKILSQEYNVIMYGDSSLRMISCNINKALAHLFKFPFLDARPLRYHTIEFTHDGMIQYLGYPPSRKFMARVKTVQAGCWLMWANSIMQEKLIEPWLDCALHVECIGPKGARHHPCNLADMNHDGRYVGCHRYDQSALNLILTREFGLDAVNKACDVRISYALWTVQRSPTKKYKVSLCT